MIQESVCDYVDTKEKIIDYFLNGLYISGPNKTSNGIGWDAGYSDGEMDRYAFEVYEGKHMVTTRFNRNKEEDSFVIYLVTQEDVGGEDDIESADWSDVEWVSYASGKLSSIEELLTEEVYQGIVPKMHEVLEVFMQTH